MKILVTGFEPFGGETENPSAQVARGLPASLAGAEIVTAILPVTCRGALETVTEAIRHHRPDAVLSLGQAGGRAAVSIERIAINVDDFSIPDNEGAQPKDQAIVPGGPAAYWSTLPIRAMEAAVRAAGVPCQISNTAGTYVCNHVMYGVAHLLGREFPGTVSGFLHIPYLPEQVLDKPGQPSMPLELSRQAVEAALTAIAGGNAAMPAGATGG